MEDNDIAKESDDGSIDLIELAKKLWSHRRKLLIWSVCGAVIGLVVAFSIPREYTTMVKLAPESNDNKGGSGGLGALASMAGISVTSSGSDAVYPMLYPDVVGSVPFLTGLFDVEVETKEDGNKMTVEKYMEELRSPWWNVVLSLPGKLISVFKSSEEVEEGHKLDPFQLTKKENDLVKSLGSRISASVDAKTSVVTVDVTMQDPVVSAMLADTVVERLKEFVTDYRTNKARQDLKYVEKLNEEAKAKYYKAQQIYADYLDRNQGIVLRSAQVERERLENEASLAFNVYNSTAQLVQRSQAKVQETMPVYAIITPATVPVSPSKPRKAIILVGFTMLGFAACAAWILFLQPLYCDFRKKGEPEEDDGENDDSAGRR